MPADTLAGLLNVAASLATGPHRRGPILRGHIGDVFNVSLINDTTMAHSVDFHASRTAMDRNMRDLAPGQSLVYHSQAQYAGIFMCHCGTTPALAHIGNGMFGAVIVDPPNLALVRPCMVKVASSEQSQRTVAAATSFTLPSRVSVLAQ